MKPQSYNSLGIVLGRRNFGEADRIITLFTKSYGKVSLLAKGIRRPKSKKRGHLEIFSLVKFQAVNGRGLDIMTEAEVVNNYEQIRHHLSKVSLAYYFCEVVNKITHELENNIELFLLIKDALDRLEQQNNLKSQRNNFVTKLLILLGYWDRDKEILDIDITLENIIERKIFSKRVGAVILKNNI